MTEEGDGGPEVLDNPAARLRFWLAKGEERAAISRTEAQRQQHGGSRVELYMMLDVWCLIWGLDKDDRADRIEYTRRAAGMIDAGVEVRRLAESSENFMAPEGLRHFAEVETALKYFMDAPSHDIATVMQNIRETGWHSLDMLDLLFHNEAPQPSLSTDEIQDLLDKDAVA